MGETKILSGWLVGCNLKDSRLHYLQLVMLFVVLVHGLDHKVESYRSVEDIFFVDLAWLLHADGLEQFPHVFTPHL